MTSPLIGFIAACVVCLVVAMLLARKSRDAAITFAAISAGLLVVTGFALWPLMFREITPAAGDSGPGDQEISNVTHADFEPYRPTEIPNDGYVTADACAECHKENHASWYDSYHRTMTQIATPEAVFGDFDDKRVSFEQQHYHLTRKGDTFWAQLSGKELMGKNQSTDKALLPIVMTTGSHHMQIYWFPTLASRVIGQLPIVYLKESQQWVPRKSCFLEPPGASMDPEIGRWNNTCLQCHSTHPKQRKIADYNWDTSVAEFGISCEACHGPGRDHIHFQRSKDRQGNDPIVNPDNLDHRLGSQVCGNCHSITTHLSDDTRNHGHAFRPGKTLDSSRHLYRLNKESIDHLAQRGDVDPDVFFARSFWPDGMVRVSGREFNGLIESACYQKGTMSCTSCHALHQQPGDPRDRKSWSNDQLGIGMLTNQACTNCHDADKYDQQHTHHEVASTGSRCYNCHMPHTTYGLMKAIRSHTITSPDATGDLRAGRPGACNLCHLDKSIGWANDRLSQWYGMEKPKLTDDQQKVASGVLWSLTGDAGMRALTAWHFGWAPAKEASGEDWMPPYLSHLLDDPYDVVRFIAGRSLGTIRGFESLAYNFVAPRQQRLSAQNEAFLLWQNKDPVTRAYSGTLLIEPSGQLMQQQFSRMAAHRDDKPMILDE